MAWYYIAFDTVKQFFTIKGTETLNELVIQLFKENFTYVQLFLSRIKDKEQKFLFLLKSSGFVYIKYKVLETKFHMEYFWGFVLWDLLTSNFFSPH